MAHRNIFITFILVIVFTASISAQTGFFIEGGVGGRYINGEIQYQPTVYYSDFVISRDPVDNYTGTVSNNSTVFNWKNNLLIKNYCIEIAD